MMDEAEFMKRVLKECGIEYIEGEGVVIHGLLGGGRKLLRYFDDGYPMSKIFDCNNNLICSCQRDCELATINYLNRYGVTW